MRTLRLALAIALGLSLRPAPAAQDLVKWRSIADGEAESKKTGKPVLYFMTADWCGPCRTMKKEVFSDPKVAKMINATFVPVEVVDRSREEGRNTLEVQKLLAWFRVRGFPTLTVSRPGSKHGFQAAGWRDKDATVEYLGTAKARFEQMEKGGREVK